MDTQLAGKVALVTGAASGIGEATAIALAEEGVKLVLTDLSREGVERVADLIRVSGGQAIAIPGDVSDWADVRSSVEQATTEFGALHLAVNNAGIGGPLGPLADVGVEAYHHLIRVNQDSVFFGLKYQIPAIIDAGGGAIVNVSSILGVVGDPAPAPYVASKHAVAGLTKAAALTYATQNVRVNSVHPGYIDTPLLKTLPEEAYKTLVSKHPIGRLGQATEVADLIVFLLSERASFITGSQHLVDGGYTAQ